MFSVDNRQAPDKAHIFAKSSKAVHPHSVSLKPTNMMKWLNLNDNSRGRRHLSTVSDGSVS